MRTFLTSRSLWAYYALFFSGTLVLVYQAFGAEVIGDSVNFLCLLFFIHGFFITRRIHVLEISLLLTLGYILPLLIRNSLKLTYVEAPSMTEFLHLAWVSTATTLAFGILFAAIGFVCKHAGSKLLQMSRSKVTTRALQDDP